MKARSRKPSDFVVFENGASWLADKNVNNLLSEHNKLCTELTSSFYRTYDQPPAERIGGENIGNQMLKVTLIFLVEEMMKIYSVEYCRWQI